MREGRGGARALGRLGRGARTWHDRVEREDQPVAQQLGRPGTRAGAKLALGLGARRVGRLPLQVVWVGTGEELLLFGLRLALAAQAHELLERRGGEPVDGVVDSVRVVHKGRERHERVGVVGERRVLDAPLGERLDPIARPLRQLGPGEGAEPRHDVALRREPPKEAEPGGLVVLARHRHDGGALTVDVEGLDAVGGEGVQFPGEPLGDGAQPPRLHRLHRLLVLRVADEGHHDGQLAREVHRVLLLRLRQLVVQHEVDLQARAALLLLQLQLPQPRELLQGLHERDRRRAAPVRRARGDDDGHGDERAPLDAAARLHVEHEGSEGLEDRPLLLLGQRARRDGSLLAHEDGVGEALALQELVEGARGALRARREGRGRAPGWA